MISDPVEHQMREWIDRFDTRLKFIDNAINDLSKHIESMEVNSRPFHTFEAIGELRRNVKRIRVAAVPDIADRIENPGRQRKLKEAWADFKESQTSA